MSQFSAPNACCIYGQSLCDASRSRRAGKGVQVARHAYWQQIDKLMSSGAARGAKAINDSDGGHGAAHRANARRSKILFCHRGNAITNDTMERIKDATGAACRIFRSCPYVHNMPEVLAAVHS